MSSPTWYDLLDVDPDASTDVVRAAWKRAVADLDPTDRRFQRLSEAAAVLLDPDKRRAYDDSLRGTEGDGPSAVPEPGTSRVGGSGRSGVGATEEDGLSAADVPEPGTSRVGGSGRSGVGAAGEDGLSAADVPEPGTSRVGGNGPERSEDRLAPTRRPRRPWRRGPLDLPRGAAASAVGDLPTTEPGISDIEPAAVEVEHDPPVRERARWTTRTVPLWVLAAAAGVALVLVVLAAFSWTRPDPKAIESGADAARAVAERAVVPVLSYDYRTLADGQKEAESYLTTRYRDDSFRPLFRTIKANAPQTQTVVTTKVVESAIVRAGEDRVEVLLLVDRPTTNKKQTTPVTYEDHVTVTMENTGDGWRIDDMTT